MPLYSPTLLNVSTANSVLGYAQITANQTGIGASADITGLSVTVNVAAGRAIRISGHVQGLTVTNPAAFLVEVQEGATVLGRLGLIPGLATGERIMFNDGIIVYPTPGTHTYKLVAVRFGGTGTLSIEHAATQPGYILVEDITGGTGGSGPIHLGYAQVVANQSGITTEVDLTGLTIAVSVPSGRRIRIYGEVNAVSSVANDYFELKIQQDGVQVQAGGVTIDAANVSMKLPISIVLSPSAGTHTYKLRAVRAVGSGTMQLAAGATYPSFILVEDITGTPQSVENLAWIDYTPTLVQSGTVTKTVNYAKYTQIGRTIHACVDLTMTGAGTTANPVLVGLPVPRISGGNPELGAMLIYDASTATRYNGCAELSTVSTVGLSWNQASASLWGQSPSIALASGDVIRLTVTYEATA